MSGFLGSGDVFIDRLLDNGTSTGLVRAGNASRLSIEPRSDEKQRVSRGRDSYGQVLDSAALAQPAILRVTFDDIDKNNLALILMGTLSAVSQTLTTVTDEDVTAVLGRFVQLAKGNIAQSGFVVTNSAATVTYVEGTDFEVNRRIGLLMAKEGGAITDGQALKVDYSAQAYTADLIRGSTKPQIKARLLMDGKNQSDGRAVIVNIPNAVLAPASEFNFLAEDFATLELQGSAVAPIGATEPFTVEIRN